MSFALSALLGALSLTTLIRASPLGHLEFRAVPATISGFDYLGCFTEASGQRALNGDQFRSDSMTVGLCATFCDDRGYPLFGVEFAIECFCGNALNAGSLSAPESECSSSCPGMPLDSCGGNDRLNVYQKQPTQVNLAVSTATATSTSTVVAYISRGCYSEATVGRALISKYTISDAMTIELCAATCSDFTLFGLEYFFECFCGNELQPGSGPVPERDCSFPCTGDPAQICGGSMRLSLYSYADDPPPDLPTLTVTAPVPTSTGSSEYTELGCFTDSITSRALTGAEFRDDFLTIELCASLCQGFDLFGVEFSNECYCGNMLEGSIQVAAAQCNFPCSGNPDQICGAASRLNVYRFAPGQTSLVSSSTILSTSILSTSLFESVTPTSSIFSTTEVTSISTPSLLSTTSFSSTASSTSVFDSTTPLLSTSTSDLQSIVSSTMSTSDSETSSPSPSTSRDISSLVSLSPTLSASESVSTSVSSASSSDTESVTIPSSFSTSKPISVTFSLSSLGTTLELSSIISLPSTSNAFASPTISLSAVSTFEPTDSTFPPTSSSEITPPSPPPSSTTETTSYDLETCTPYTITYSINEAFETVYAVEGMTYDF